MKVYNTLTSDKQEFKPIDKGLVKMYTCGVTVYGPLHLGHARTYVAYDVIKEYFKFFKNLKVMHVQNITDVGSIVGDADQGDDKIEKRAIELGQHPMELVDANIKGMWDGLDALRCSRPNISPRATGHITEIIEAVQKMIDNGFAYVVDGDVYCDVSKIKNYGALSHNTLESLNAGARVAVGDKKKSPFDFSVWKKAKPNSVLKWNSPWGIGYPGWHIECTVMSQKYLGNTFDIHGGAKELSFPHHENEIAQSYALCGCEPAKYWVHTGLLNVEGAKMAKSVGNFIKVEDALGEYGAGLLRWFFVGNHYASPINFTKDAVAAAKAGYERLANFWYNLNSNVNSQYNTTLTDHLTTLVSKFSEAMDDDFNTPNAIAAIYDFVREANQIISTKCYNLDNIAEIKAFFNRVNQVFKAFDFLDKKEDAEDARELHVRELIEERNKYRAEKQFSKADKVKEQLIKMNVEIFDNKDGTTTFRLK